MNKVSPALALVLLAAVLPSCTSNRSQSAAAPMITQETAALNAPERWAFGPETDGEVAASWSEIIKDEALLALMDEALAANPSLRASAESVRRSEALLRQSRSGLLPSLGANAGASGSSPFEDADLTESYSLGVSASWEADLWGAIRSDILASEYDLVSTEAVFRASREAVAAGVARAYVVAIDAGNAVFDRGFHHGFAVSGFDDAFCAVIVNVSDLCHLLYCLLQAAGTAAAMSFIETDVSPSTPGASFAPDMISFFEARNSGGLFTASTAIRVPLRR